MLSPVLATLLARDATPEGTLRGFVEALNGHNPVGLSRRVLGGRTIGLGYTSSSPRLTLTPVETKVKGDSATVRADVTASDVFRQQVYHETVDLRRIDGDWKIVPPSAELLEWPNPAPIGFFAVIVASSGKEGRALRAVEKTISLSNVKQIAIATLMYAQDNDNRLPPASKLKAAVLPYLKDAAVFTAPGEPKGTVSYFLDPRLSGRIMTSPSYPAETAMILQGTSKRVAFPYAGRTTMAYLDGHAKIVDAATVQKARAKELK